MVPNKQNKNFERSSKMQIKMGMEIFLYSNLLNCSQTKQTIKNDLLYFFVIVIFYIVHNRHLK